MATCLVGASSLLTLDTRHQPTMTTDPSAPAPEAERALRRDLDLLQTLPAAVLERLIDPEAAPAPPPASVKEQLAKLSSSKAPADAPADASADQPAEAKTDEPNAAQLTAAEALSEAYIKEMRERGAELARDEEGSGRSLEFRSRIERVREVAEGVQTAVEDYAQTAGV